MTPPIEQKDGLARFRSFLAGDIPDRIFAHPTGHPSQPTGFCPCDRSLLPRLWFYLKATVLVLALKLPFNRPKIHLLRNFGARIGRNVYVSVDAWIDPSFPQLLTIEDGVLIGVGVKIFLHEFRRDRFQAGRVTIKKGAIIGGCAIIGNGVEVGERAVVAGGAVVGRDVPPGMMAIGNPARVLPINHE
jgi:acetyltransferase-like isoleucine patch superfamily enzyme